MVYTLKMLINSGNLITTLAQLREAEFILDRQLRECLKNCENQPDTGLILSDEARELREELEDKRQCIARMEEGVLEEAIKGTSFKPGRPEGSLSDHTKEIYALVKEYPNKKAKEIHAMVKHPEAKILSSGRFANIVCEARKSEK